MDDPVPFTSTLPVPMKPLLCEIKNSQTNAWPCNDFSQTSSLNPLEVGRIRHKPFQLGKSLLALRRSGFSPARRSWKVPQQPQSRGSGSHSPGSLLTHGKKAREWPIKRHLLQTSYARCVLKQSFDHRRFPAVSFAAAQRLNRYAWPTVKKHE